MEKFEKDKDQDITLAIIMQKLIDIESKVNTTNGRVKSLEIWKAYIIGGGAVIVTMIGWVMQK